MVAPASVVRTNAKKLLKGNMSNGIFASAILVAAFVISMTVCSLVGAVFGAIGYYAALVLLFAGVIIPLVLGELRYIKRLMAGIKEPVSAVFLYFSESKLYVRAIKLILGIASRLVVTAIAVMLPAAVVRLFSGEWIYGVLGIDMPLFASNLWMTGYVFYYIGLALLFLISLKYYLSFYIFISNSTADISEILKVSCVISKRTYFDFLLLILSLSFWILLSVMQLPLVFLFPYLAASYCIHSALAVKQYNTVVESMKIDDKTPFYSA